MKELTNKEQYFIDCSKKVLAAILPASESMCNRTANDCINDSVRIANRMKELLFDENDAVRNFSDIEKLLDDTPIDFQII